MKLRLRLDTFLIQMHISFVSIRGKLLSALSCPAILFADHAAPWRSAGCCFIHSASCGAPPSGRIALRLQRSPRW
jgi:hypothetical protein